MSDELIAVVQILKSVYELDISKYDEAFLKQTVEKRCIFVKATNIYEYVQIISNNFEEVTALLKSLQITHTDFFRNILVFAHLEQWILPSLFERKPEASELRIWSAGCSSGQEAYSIAMLIENIHHKKSRLLRYRIIATDISQSALLRAKKGEFSEHDIQNIRVKDLNEFFVKRGETYTICDRLKEHVSFSNYDLLDPLSSYPQESIFGNFDLVVCSNILFYYKPMYQQSIVKKLIYSMDKNGYLITGEAEKHTIERYSKLTQVTSLTPIYKQKRGVE
jgi:chemotaxis methyl-accepting protein methylase